MNKSCRCCRAIKPIEEFSRKKDAKDGCSGRCKACDRKYKREYRTWPGQKEKIREQDKATRDRLKFLVLATYCNGYPQCVRCGVKDVDVLCIDHIEGGGGKERRKSRCWGYSFYRWIRDNDFPKSFQVLCYNCNQKKRIVEGR